MKRIIVAETDLLDCRQIAVGTYSPLKGFMDKETLESVLSKNRLPGGLPWTMPVLLQLNTRITGKISKRSRVALTNGTGEIYALMDVRDHFYCDLKKLARDWFGTDSSEHPRVAAMLAGGDSFLGGDILLVRRLETAVSSYELTPAQSRFVFTHKGWSKVVGFHTRNVAHRAHEYIQLRALESTNADGLYISPVLGLGNKGDFHPQVVLNSYQAMIENGVYPAGKVVLGCFLTYPRFCGPREAVFTMLCRKNMGCSHFIIGRNHAGTGGHHYKEADYRRLFESLGDVGIRPVFFDDIGYDHKKHCYGPVGGGPRQMISGTEARLALRGNKRLPEWFMRAEVQDVLFERMLAGRPVFCE